MLYRGHIWMFGLCKLLMITHRTAFLCVSRFDSMMLRRCSPVGGAEGRSSRLGMSWKT